jgi:hypothetical protein
VPKIPHLPKRSERLGFAASEGVRCRDPGFAQPVLDRVEVYASNAS